MPGMIFVAFEGSLRPYFLYPNSCVLLFSETMAGAVINAATF